MLKEKQDIRRQQIQAAAYELLEDKGYKATSMLAIAKQAKASNETLYAWYGSKQNLFRALITDNAAEVTATIKQALTQETDLKKALNRIGPLLLTLVLSDKAIALNRAAAADANETKVLGETLASAGKNAVQPLIQELFEQARARQTIDFDDKEQISNVYLSLLIGDLQIRRVTGAIPKVTKAQINRRSSQAVTLLLTLFPMS
ncbi:MAG: TetR/AcrR family transcriptional regulator [Arenicella sp.]